MLQTADEISVDWHKLHFGVERSIRYHGCRSDFLRHVSKSCTWVSALLGAGTVGAVLSKSPTAIQVLLPVAGTAASFFNIIWDARGLSEKHKDFKTQYTRLLDEIDEVTEVNREVLNKFNARRRRIEADEPAAIKTLDVRCHNDLVRAKGYDDGEFVDLKWWQILTSQIYSLGPIPKKRGELHPPQRPPEVQDTVSPPRDRKSEDE